MSITTASLKVTKLVRETADATTIHFAKPASGFDYLPGQYLTLKLTVNGEALRRAYSLCSTPKQDADLAVTVKRVEDGRASNWLNTELKEGDQLEVLSPMGNFSVTTDSSAQKHYVLVGGGSGITPLMSILRAVLADEPQSKVTLLYGNRNENSIIFKSALEQLEAAHPNRFRVMHALDTAPEGWNGISGQLNRHATLKIAQDIVQSDSLPKSFYICGPGPMMEEVQAGLKFLGIPQTSIHQEYFDAPLGNEDAEASESGSSDHEAKPGDYDITVILGGKEQKVHVKESDVILDAVIDEGMDPPYACQMGVCTTCRAKLYSGKVEMEEDEGLSDAEIEDGYILTCQSHPLTPDVKLEYK